MARRDLTDNEKAANGPLPGDRSVATGRILAESDFFEPLTVNSLIVPGYGGRMYYPTATGFIILQVQPAGQS